MKRTFNQVERDFLENHDVRPNSREVYKMALRRFKQWVIDTGRDVRTLRRADIIAYKASLIESGKSEKTIDLYLTSVRLFYEYCEQNGEHENIAAGVRLRHKKEGFTKSHLNMEEVRRLLDSIETDTTEGKRDYAIINLMLRSGIRCIEASRLRVCDIQQKQDGYVITLQRKGDNARSERLGLTAKAMQPVMDYLAFRGVGGELESVFVSHGHYEGRPLSSITIGLAITRRMKKAGVYSKSKTPHSLRHTAAVMAIQHNVPTKAVQVMLGHRRIVTTEAYLKSVDEDIRLDNPATRVLDDLF